MSLLYFEEVANLKKREYLCEFSIQKKILESPHRTLINLLGGQELG